MSIIATPRRPGEPSPEQLALFEERTPRRPYCTDDLERGLLIRSRRQAIGSKRYIQANPPHLRCWLILDVDRPGAALAWDDACLPEPAWSAMNRANGHAHLAWGISAPVLTGDVARQQPLRYLAAIESAYRAAVDGDEAYAGLVTKNPRHTAWRTFWGRHMFRELADLAEYVDLPRHLPRRGIRPEKIGLGRNCDLFEHLRRWAYPEVRGWKLASTQGAVIYWQKEVYRRALDYTSAEHPVPLDPRECWHTARSVALWVWNRFDITASDRRFSIRQSARGKLGGRPRATTAEQAARAHELAAGGMSIRGIATELGVGKSTVARLLSQKP